MLRAEAELLQEMKHDNVVKLKGVKETESHIYIIMELIDGGKLSKLISEHSKQGKIWKFLYELLI